MIRREDGLDVEAHSIAFAFDSQYPRVFEVHVTKRVERPLIAGIGATDGATRSALTSGRTPAHR
jgi:hypothetical protein